MIDYDCIPNNHHILKAQIISHPTLVHSQSRLLFASPFLLWQHYPSWSILTHLHVSWNPKLPDWPWLIRTLTGAGCTPDTCATTRPQNLLRARGRAKRCTSLRTKIEPHFSFWNWQCLDSILISLSLLVNNRIPRDELTTVFAWETHHCWAQQETFFWSFLCRTCAAYIIFVASDHAHLDINIVEISKFWGVYPMPQTIQININWLTLTNHDWGSS